MATWFRQSSGDWDSTALNAAGDWNSNTGGTGTWGKPNVNGADHIDLKGFTVTRAAAPITKGGKTYSLWNCTNILNSAAGTAALSAVASGGYGGAYFKKKIISKVAAGKTARLQGSHFTASAFLMDNGTDAGVVNGGLDVSGSGTLLVDVGDHLHLGTVATPDAGSGDVANYSTLRINGTLHLNLNTNAVDAGGIGAADVGTIYVSATGQVITELDCTDQNFPNAASIGAISGGTFTNYGAVLVHEFHCNSQGYGTDTTVHLYPGSITCPVSKVTGDANEILTIDAGANVYDAKAWQRALDVSEVDPAVILAGNSILGVAGTAAASGGGGGMRNRGRFG